MTNAFVGNAIAVIMLVYVAMFLAPTASAYTETELADLRSSAAVGDAQAMNRLGDAYRRGLGVASNPTTAEMHYRAAIDAGKLVAVLRLASVVADQGRIKEAKELLDEAAKNRMKGAERTRAEFHVLGKFGYLSDPESGEAVLSRLGSQGDQRAAYILANALDGGQSLLEKDFSRAAKLYASIKDSGHARAAEKYAILQFRGNGLKEDRRSAIAIMRTLAADGHPRVQRSLARMLIEAGRPEEAINALKAAVQNGDETAKFELARAHVRGSLGPKSRISEGSKSLLAMSDYGDNAATRELSRLMRRQELALEEANIATKLKYDSDSGDLKSTVELLRFIRVFPDSLPNSFALRKRLISENAALLSQRHVVPEQINLLLETREGKKLYERITRLLTETSPDGYEAGLRTLHRRDKNAYTWILQYSLQSLGEFEGNLNGKMTKSTIRAIQGFCRRNGIYDTCRKGPLKSASAKVIAGTLAKKLKDTQAK